MSNKNYMKEEFIGHPVLIKDCKDPRWIGRDGIVIDETKNTFLLSMKFGIKRIAKNIARFEFKVNDNKFEICGSKINYRPEDRIKKAR
jgi:ribonuclease P protein subunit POP4